ncbi:hypothetical protein DTL70_01085 [Streptomyces diacarni]|uniref:Transposase n=1 Tax=Streptomyces diacarni TaxID=2800381 RepID=A0A367FH77_9ACTN|nr:hypothetical protein DTL70_01085 [Streptomyces diacarni]
MRAGGRAQPHDPRAARQRGEQDAPTAAGSIAASHHLGRHRWMVERTVSWLSVCPRLDRRYEVEADHFLALISDRYRTM